MRYHLTLLGPPGAGKGTQARRLAVHYRLAHLASGDLLRTEVEANTPLGRQVASLLARGELVPDEVLMPLIAGRIAALSPETGLILDGVPRTLDQAVELERTLTALKRPLDAAVLLEVPDEVVTERLLARGRPDDVRSVIEDRLAIYHHQISPLRAFYADRDVLRVVDGRGDEDTVFRRLVETLNWPAPSAPGE